MPTLLDRITMLTRIARRTLMVSCWLALALAGAANCLCVLTAAQYQSGATGAVTESQNHAPRIVVPVRGARDVVFDEPVVSVTVVDPEFVAVELKGSTLIRFIALREGETMVLVSGVRLRRTYMVEVRPRPAETAEQLAAEAARRQRALLRPTGVYAVSFSPSFGAAPALLRQSFDYSRKLDGGRTLRVSADTFKFLGGGERGLVTHPALSFGLDRLTLGIDTRAAKLDLLDSELNLSPLTFDGYTMRGVHLSSAADSRLRGLEFFAGLARPSLTLFDNKEGYVGGATLPVARGVSWRVRAGMFVVRSRRDDINGAGGGVVWHADGRYAPDERTKAEGELAFADGSFSWRARLDLRRGPFDISGESLRLDRRSPLVRVNAQSGGRKLDAFGVVWQPSARLGAHFSYSRAANVFLVGARRAALNNSSLFAGVSYNLTRDSRLGVRFTRQGIETSAHSLSLPLRLDTRGASLTHSIRFGGRWTNDFEVGFTSTRESRAGAQFERGQNLRDELRRNWDRWSASAYFSYTRNTPSLAGLVARNPDLLPPLLRRAYEADPARFLILNRELLPAILGGVTLPETRSLDAGLRLQGTLSRYTLTSDMRYSAGEFFARKQRSILGTFNADVRLDAANSVRVSGARSFALNGMGGQSAVTISYVHRFGAEGGFQFGRLFGLGRGQIAGRVFFDLDGDGRDDAEEPGVAHIKIQLDGGRSVTTDESGRFRFSSVNPGEYTVALTSDALGVRWRATTSTEQLVSLSAGQTINVGFGVTSHGFIAGQVFNDLYLTGAHGTANAPGVERVRVSLRPLGAGSSGPSLTQTVDAGGAYEFRNLAPGSYTLEVDPATLPADFELPAQTSWPVTIKALEGVYLDVPLVAHRAASGYVFIDKDGDGKYTPDHDEPVTGARLVAGKVKALTDRQGAFILRNLPAGKVDVSVYTPDGNKIAATNFELGARPVLRSGVNIAVAPYGLGASAAARRQ